MSKQTLRLPLDASAYTNLEVDPDALTLEGLAEWIRGVGVILSSRRIEIESLRVAQLRVRLEDKGTCTVAGSRGSKNYEWYDSLSEGLERALALYNAVVESEGVYAFANSSDPLERARRVVAGAVERGLMQVIRQEIEEGVAAAKEETANLRRLLIKRKQTGLVADVRSTEHGLQVAVLGTVADEEEMAQAIVRRLTLELAALRTLLENTPTRSELVGWADFSFEDLDARGATRLAEWVADAEEGQKLELQDVTLELEQWAPPHLRVTVSSGEELCGSIVFDQLVTTSAATRFVTPLGLLTQELEGVMAALTEDEEPEDQGPGLGARVVSSSRTPVRRSAPGAMVQNAAFGAPTEEDTVA